MLFATIASAAWLAEPAVVGVAGTGEGVGCTAGALAEPFEPVAIGAAEPIGFCAGRAGDLPVPNTNTATAAPTSTAPALATITAVRFRLPIATSDVDSIGSGCTGTMYVSSGLAVGARGASGVPVAVGARSEPGGGVGNVEGDGGTNPDAPGIGYGCVDAIGAAGGMPGAVVAGDMASAIAIGDIVCIGAMPGAVGGAIGAMPGAVVDGDGCIDNAGMSGAATTGDNGIVVGAIPGAVAPGGIDIELAIIVADIPGATTAAIGAIPGASIGAPAAPGGAGYAGGTIGVGIGPCAVCGGASGTGIPGKPGGAAASVAACISDGSISTSGTPMPVGFSSHSIALSGSALATATTRLPDLGCFGGGFSTFAGAVQPSSALGSADIVQSPPGPLVSPSAFTVAFADALLSLSSSGGSAASICSVGRTLSIVSTVRAGNIVGITASGVIVQSSPWIAAMISAARMPPERAADAGSIVFAATVGAFGFDGAGSSSDITISTSPTPTPSAVLRGSSPRAGACVEISLRSVVSSCTSLAGRRTIGNGANGVG